LEILGGRLGLNSNINHTLFSKAAILLWQLFFTFNVKFYSNEVYFS